MSHKVLKGAEDQAPLQPPGGTAPDGGLSPNFVEKETSIWDQRYLVEAMLQMKDSEVAKLRFSDTCYKPYEYEKWLCGVTRVMIAIHPEMGAS